MSSETTIGKRLVTEAAINRWKQVVDLGALPRIESNTRRKQLVALLENATQHIRSEASNRTGDIAKYDPVLISLLRRTMPNLVGNRLVGVQPMTGPTGLVFAQRVYYGDPSTGTETWNQNRPDVTHTGTAGGEGLLTADGELLGVDKETTDSGSGFPHPVSQVNPWPEMTMGIDSIEVRARTRALKSTFTHEMVEDLRSIHGLDAETELATILQAEVQAEIDYEILAFVDSQAKNGGTINIQTDTDGRWSAERYVGLIRLLGRQSNIIGQETRRGRATYIVTTPDVADALEMTGRVDTSFTYGDLNTDVTGITMVGRLAGKWDLYIDPYATSGTDWALLGYRGTNDYDAGGYYCPYTPMTFYRANGEDSFQPRIGFKTRYGLIHNPYAPGTAGQNPYFRKVDITNL